MMNRTNWAVAAILTGFLGLWLADGLTDGLGILLYPDHSLFREWYPRFHLPAFIVLRGLYPLLFTLLAFFLLRRYAGSAVGRAALSGLLFGVAVLLLQGHATIGLLTALALTLAVLAVTWERRRVLCVLLRPFTDERPDALNASRPWLILLMVAAAGLRVWLLVHTDNSEHADSACRFLHTQIWADYYVPWGDWRLLLNPTPQWLPLHFILSGIIYLLTADELAVRGIHVLAGLVTAVYVFRIARLIDSDNASPFIATAGFLLYPAAMAGSMQVLSEPLYIMFLCMAFFHFLREWKHPSLNALTWRVVAVLAASLLRFEGWGLPFVFFALATVRDRSITWREVVALPLSLTGAFAVCMENWISGLDPLWGLWINRMMVDYNYSLEQFDLNLFVKGYRDAWIPLGLASTIAVIPVFHENSRLRYYVLFSLLLLLPFLHGTVAGTLYPEFRYVTQYCILFIIPLAYLMVRVCQSVLGRSVAAIAASLMVVLCCVSFGHGYIFPKKMRFPDGFNESIRFVTRSIPEGEFILDYHQNVASYQWMASLRMPYVPEHVHPYLTYFVEFEVVRAVSDSQPDRFPKRVRYAVNHFDQAFCHIRDDEIREVLHRYDAVYVMLFPNGPLNDHLRFTSTTARAFGVTFEKVFDQHGYRIYKKTGGAEQAENGRD